MHPHHQFIEAYLKDAACESMFDVAPQPRDFLSEYSVDVSYVRRLEVLYGERIKSASYNAKLAYSECGTPLFINEFGELNDGIYIGIPIDVYHSLDCLSSTMIKKYHEAPALYKRLYIDDINRLRTVTQTRTFDTGELAHELVLEPVGFMHKYYRGLTHSDRPGSVNGLSELKAIAEKVGATKLGSTKLSISEAIFAVDQTYALFPLLEKAHKEANDNKIEIDPIVFDDAVRSAFTVLSHPDAGGLFNPDEGLPEVSIIYSCPKTGMKKRTRFDFLRFDKKAVDLKTTKSTKPSSFSKDFVKLGYGIQEAMYRESFECIEGEPLDEFIFVAVEYAMMDACETFSLSIDDLESVAKVYYSTLTSLQFSLERNIWPGYSDDSSRKMIVKQKFLEW